MLTRVTLPGIRYPPRNLVTSLQIRTYKKEKITPEKIAEAKQKQARQGATFVDKYYQKWGRKKILGDKDQKKKKRDGEDEDEDESNPKDISLNEFRMWNRERREEHLDRWTEGNDLCLSIEARVKSAELHLAEPHYWTPVRLSALFKCRVEYMRCLLFEAKLAAEAKSMGNAYIQKMEDLANDGGMDFVSGRSYEVDKEELEEIKAQDAFANPPWDDWEIDKGLANIFGTVDFPNEFSDPPEDIPIRKIHNPWYFIDPGMKSGELLKFVRSRETRHYRECSRIPQQQYPKMKEFNEVLGPGVTQRKFPHKKSKWTIYDSSPQYTLYDRPILIRDHDNTWRRPTWDERRKIFMDRKQVRYPTKVPFVYPDESQPDKRALRDKPPASFTFYNPGHDLDPEIIQNQGLVEWPENEPEEIESDREFMRKGALGELDSASLELQDSPDVDIDPEIEGVAHDNPYPFQSRYQSEYDM